MAHESLLRHQRVRRGSALGAVAEEMLAATERASWRIYASSHVLDELQRVVTEELGFSPRLASLSRGELLRRASMAEPGASHHDVPQDAKDMPILRAALDAEAATWLPMTSTCLTSILTRACESFP